MKKLNKYQKKMKKYNVYSRLKRVNLDDLDGMEVSELVPLIVELNILVQDLGKRLKSYGDNKLDELDEACGNAEARRIFSCVDEFINHDGNVFKDDYYKNKLREKLTAFMFEALEAARNMAVSENAEAAAMTDSAKSENAAAVKLTQVLSELDDAEQETEAANFAKKKAVAELDCAKSENEKLKAAIKICGGTCMHMIGVQDIVKGVKKP